MSFITPSLEGGTTSQLELDKGVVGQAPKLVSTNNFRKAIMHI